MNPIITKDLLAAAGVEVKPEDEESFIEHVNDTLQERVGAEVVESLDDEQLDQLATLQEADDQDAIQTWMAENVPELEDIVKDEVDILLGELVESTDSVNE